MDSCFGLWATISSVMSAQNIASDFLIFAQGLSSDLSKFSDDFPPFFQLWKTITKSLDKN